MTPTKATSPDPPSGRPVRWWVVILVSVLPLVITLVLYGRGIPFGRADWMAYPYSQMVAQRFAQLPLALLWAAIAACGVWLTGSAVPKGRAFGLTVIGLACSGMAVWSFTAPPQYRSQHFFNMCAPSQDGAFLTEAGQITDLGEYLSGFGERAQTSKDQMRGTRVISNPPGITLLALLVDRSLERWPTLSKLMDPTLPGDELTPAQTVLVVRSNTFACSLCLIWLASLPLFYLASRLFLSTSGAAAVAVCSVFTPMTLLFTPGKDPAQLFAMALPLWLWMTAVARNRPWLAILAGLAVVGSIMVSLVMAWLGLLVFVASLCQTTLGRFTAGQFTRRLVLPAVAGVGLATVALYLVWNCNLLALLWEVARAQATVTRGTGSMPYLWQLLGMPMYLLLAGPALAWVGLGLAKRSERAESGKAGWILLVGSVLVMLATVGFTLMETIRLWIPFTPLLLLGSAMQLRGFVESKGRRRVLLAVLVFVQLAVSASQWSLFDARESEMRLIGDRPRFFD